MKPAEELSEAEREFVLRYFFQANADHLIYRYPRYGELFDVWKACGANPQVAAQHFSVQDLRDLQVLSQVAWFDEEFQEHDEEVKALIAKGRDYSLDDQALMARKEREILAAVVPVYKEFAARGQIEISTTPFYHPILPLICDSNIASVSHPGVTLPTRFQYPQDALHQLKSAREFMERQFGRAPVGLWPSEGSVSDEALSLAAEAGFQWAASDNGVLARTTQPGRRSGSDLPVVLVAATRPRASHDFSRSLLERSSRIRVFQNGRRKKPRRIFWIAFARTRGRCWSAARTCWFRSFWMARTLGNTTITTAGHFCASCTGGSANRRIWRR